MANQKIPLYGRTNKVIAEINAHILKHKDLTKFLYYTGHEYEDVNILELDDVPTSEIYNKLFFVYKRFPEVINEAGAYIYMNIYRQTPLTLGGKVNSITFTIDVLVHKDYLTTAHGNRIVCIYEALNDAICNCVRNTTTIGGVNLVRIAPILGVVKDFDSYAIQYEAHTFRGLN